MPCVLPKHMLWAAHVCWPPPPLGGGWNLKCWANLKSRTDGWWGWFGDVEAAGEAGGSWESDGKKLLWKLIAHFLRIHVCKRMFTCFFFIHLCWANPIYPSNFKLSIFSLSKLFLKMPSLLSPCIGMAVWPAKLNPKQIPIPWKNTTQRMMSPFVFITI